MLKENFDKLTNYLIKISDKSLGRLLDLSEDKAWSSFVAPVTKLLSEPEQVVREICNGEMKPFIVDKMTERFMDNDCLSHDRHRRLDKFSYQQRLVIVLTALDRMGFLNGVKSLSGQQYFDAMTKGDYPNREDTTNLYNHTLKVMEAEGIKVLASSMRTKSLESIEGKIDRYLSKGSKITKFFAIYDISGVRIIVAPKDRQKASEAIQKYLKVANDLPDEMEPVRDFGKHDWINRPHTSSPNYKAIHITAQLDNNRYGEVQIFGLEELISADETRFNYQIRNGKKIHELKLDKLYVNGDLDKRLLESRFLGISQLLKAKINNKQEIEISELLSRLIPKLRNSINPNDFFNTLVELQKPSGESVGVKIPNQRLDPCFISPGVILGTLGIYGSFYTKIWDLERENYNVLYDVF